MIALIISEICSKAAIILTLLVCIIFVFRIVGKRLDRGHWVNRWNRNLRKKHIRLSIALMIVAVLHGVFSYVGIFKITWGLVSTVLLMMLAITYLLRKKLKRKWILWHRILIMVFLISLSLHFIEIDSFREEYHQNTKYHYR